MVNLDNHLHHENCTHYIYATLGISEERKGFLYIGQHKCRKKGKFDVWYFGSGNIIKGIAKKYGKDYVNENFRTIPLWWCGNQDEADEMEKFFIAEYETMEIGMNLCEGGFGGREGFVVTDETKRRLSESKKGNKNPMFGRIGELNSMYGKHHTEEARRKMSETLKGRQSWNKGKHHSEEERLRQSERMKGMYCGEENPFYGKHHSEEARRKMSEAKQERCKGKGNSNFKGITQAIKDGVVVAEFDGAKAINDFIGKRASSSVYACINGKGKTAYGYEWRRVEK